MSYALLTLILALGAADRPPALEKAVATYWDSLAARNRIVAMKFVAAESRDAFLQRPVHPFRSWSLVDVVPAGPESYTVFVKAEKVALGAGFHDLTVAERWVWRDEAWKVQLPDYSQARRLWSRSRKVKPGAVRVLPSSVSIHFIGSPRQAVIAVENGLDEEITLERMDYDATRFQVVGAPQTVSAGGRTRFALRYTGRETAKNLAGELTLHIKQGSRTEPFTIPVKYNVVSPATRALFGLTEQDAERLENFEGLTPIFQVPNNSRHPEPSQSETAPARLPDSQD